MDMAGAGGFAAAAISWGVFGVFLLGLATNAWWNGLEDGESSSEAMKPPWRPPSLLGPEPIRTINLGVVGLLGSGKSSLVNALRNLQPNDPDAAPVGIEETTIEPTPYSFTMDDEFIAKMKAIGCILNPDRKGSEEKDTIGESDEPTEAKEDDGTAPPMRVTIWDLPAIGTWRYPYEGCVRTLGLEYFDLVAIVYTSRISEIEVQLATVLKETFSVPIFVVRSQVDSDMENEQEDYARSEEDVLMKMRSEAYLEGLPSVHLISSRHPEKYDFPQLLNNIYAIVKAGERSPREAECPICFETFSTDGEFGRCTCRWCRNSMCLHCADQLRGILLEAPCPFCRRMTALVGDNHPERLPIWSF